MEWVARKLVSKMLWRVGLLDFHNFHETSYLFRDSIAIDSPRRKARPYSWKTKRWKWKGVQINHGSTVRKIFLNWLIIDYSKKENYVQPSSLICLPFLSVLSKLRLTLIKNRSIFIGLLFCALLLTGYYYR